MNLVIDFQSLVKFPEKNKHKEIYLVRFFRFIAWFVLMYERKCNIDS